MSRTIGLRDVYIAPITQNDLLSYIAGEPQKLAKAINGKVLEKFNVEPSYADDQLDENVRVFVGVDIELEVSYLDPKVREILFGQKYVKGGATGNVNDKGQEFALGYRAKNTSNKYEFFWYYVCSCNEPDERNFETVSDKPKVQNPKIKISARQREIDENYKYTIDESALQATDSDAKALLAVNPTTKIIKWFEEVPEPLEA